MQYRKKPVVIDAVKWTGENLEKVLQLTGVMLVNIGDYIIKGVKGECYPCKPDVFLMTYEKV